MPQDGRFGDPSASPSWNGWGVDASNARFQPAKAAQLPANQITKLKLKWAFGFPGVRSVLGQPSVVGGRVFLGVDTGSVYVLDAASGCLYWSYQAEAGVRTAITIERSGPARYAAYFGDLKANVYAVDAVTGSLLWKVRADAHPSARITGAPKLCEGRRVCSGRLGRGVRWGQPEGYECCTFRGSVVALDAQTGQRSGRRTPFAEAAKPAAQEPKGTQRWGPSGGGVWNSPTIDLKRRALYVGTGDA